MANDYDWTGQSLVKCGMDYLQPGPWQIRSLAIFSKNFTDCSYTLLFTFLTITSSLILMISSPIIFDKTPEELQ